MPHWLPNRLLIYHENKEALVHEHELEQNLRLHLHSSYCFSDSHKQTIHMIFQEIQT